MISFSFRPSVTHDPCGFVKKSMTTVAGCRSDNKLNDDDDLANGNVDNNDVEERVQSPHSIFDCSQECFNITASNCQHQTIVLPSFKH